MPRLAFLSLTLVLAIPAAAACGKAPRASTWDDGGALSPGGDDDDQSDGGGFVEPTDDGGSFESEDGGVTEPVPEDASCAKATAAAIRPPVDVIMTIDQSGSMLAKITKVKDNINQLSSYLDKTGFDYRLVMVAENGETGFQVCVPAPLGEGPPGCGSTAKLRVVNQNVQSNNELQILLDTFPKYSDFLRVGALKVFVILTDDNSSAPNPTAGSFDQSLLALPGGFFGTAAKRNYVAYPIIGASDYPDEARCGLPVIDSVNNGPEYIALAKLTKGKWFSICAPDYAPVFEGMAKSIITAVACEYSVPPPPKGETLDPGKVSVIYTPGGGGGARQIKKDDTKACESGANGWQYNAGQTKVRLCGKACSQVQADVTAKIDVRFGCAPDITIQ